MSRAFNTPHMFQLIMTAATCVLDISPKLTTHVSIKYKGKEAIEQRLIFREFLPLKKQQGIFETGIFCQGVKVIFPSSLLIQIWRIMLN